MLWRVGACVLGLWSVGCGATESGPEEAQGGAGGDVGQTAGASTDGPPGQVAFDEAQVLEVALTLSAEDWNDLEEYGNAEEYVPAAVSISGAGFDALSLPSVGLRHKGNYTLHHCWDDNGGVRSHADECRKLSYKIKFDEYEDEARFDGLKRLNLHAASGDASKLREFLAYSAFRDFGVDAPRAVPARVTINGALQGLFIAVEEVDGRYTKAHFPDGPDGNLYKEVWPRSEVLDEEFVAALETNEDAADVSALRGFAEAIADSDRDDFVERMEPWVDLENVLRYLAVDRAIKNWDGINAFYSPTSPHNFYWYHDDGADDLFHLVPWDLDNTFWEFDPYMYPEQWATNAPVPDWNVEPRDCLPRSVWDTTGAVTITPPRCDPFLDLLAETSWERFVELGNELLDGPLAEATLSRKLAQHRAQIAALVASDPTLDRASWEASVNGMPLIFERLRRDFEALLARGLREEVAPSEPAPPDDVDAPTVDDGLLVGGVTNFEFSVPPAEPQPGSVFVYGDTLASYVASWNQTAPLSGAADLRFDFTFRRQPGAYDEYVGLGILTAAEVDLSPYTELVWTFATDTVRTVRVRLGSPVYDQVWGGIWSEFGVDLSGSPSPRTVAVRLDSFAYPAWAKAAWTAGQGFTALDAEARRAVLARFNGLIFGPAPTVDGSGELLTDPETGFLQVDNLYFR